MERCKGKTAIITGSTSGIGKGIAYRLSSEGANVVINSYREQDDIDEILSDVTSAGGEAFFARADLGKVEEIHDLFEQAVQRFGQIDVLVNNAGIQIRSPLLDVTESDFDRVISVNMKGYYFAAQTYVRFARKHGHKGAIVNISSVHEIIPFPNFDSYAMSKGGVMMMMKNLAIELAPIGIRVNNVAPGAINTDINDALNENPDLKEKLFTNISMGRMGSVEEVAAVVAFLASDESSYVTGSTYTVDGGLTYHYTEQ